MVLFANARLHLGGRILLHAVDAGDSLEESLSRRVEVGVVHNRDVEGGLAVVGSGIHDHRFAEDLGIGDMNLTSVGHS